MVAFECPACEYGYELAFALPHAYWLHLQGLLQSTSSVEGTAPLYYFSPAHHERDERRHFQRLTSFDNSHFGQETLDMRRWVPPPLKSQYSALGHGLDLPITKPLLILGNKYCDEWNRGSVHFINPDCLARLLTVLSTRFSIVYIRPDSREGRGYNHDHNTIYPMAKDYEVARSFGNAEVYVFQDLLSKHPELDYNTLQLAVCALADDFVCVQGGFSVLACYFAKRCLIYAREGSELQSGAFHTWFHRFSSSVVDVAHSTDSLLHLCTLLVQHVG